MANWRRLVAIMCLQLVLVITANADGLHDIEIIEPGQYPSQQSTTAVKGIMAPIPISSRLVDRIRLPKQVIVQPLSANSLTSLSPQQCPTHVHRFYYSGNSEFQCPIIRGGRTRIVTVHPKTGEPIEFFVMLSDGAPRVVYRKDHFAYVYKNHRTIVNFPAIGPLQPRVTVDQANGRSFGQYAHAVTDHWRHAHDTFQNTNTAQAMKSSTEESKAVLLGSGVLLDRAVGGTIDASRRISDLIPGKSYLQSLKEQRALDVRDAVTREEQRSSEGIGRFIQSNQ